MWYDAFLTLPDGPRTKPSFEWGCSEVLLRRPTYQPYSELAAINLYKKESNSVPHKVFGRRAMPNLLEFEEGYVGNSGEV